MIASFQCIDDTKLIRDMMTSHLHHTRDITSNRTWVSPQSMGPWFPGCQVHTLQWMLKQKDVDISLSIHNSVMHSCAIEKHWKLGTPMLEGFFGDLNRLIVGAQSGLYGII